MKVFIVTYEKFADEEYESGIIQDACFLNEARAYEKMMEEAQNTLDDWNDDVRKNFTLQLYPKGKMCSICGDFESDYYNIGIVEMEAN